MDRRRQAREQVKEKITGALLRLMGEKSISEITVTELIAEAGWPGPPSTGTTPPRRASSPP